VHVLTVNISSNPCTVWYTIYDISTPYRVEQNIYCYVDCIPLLWWVPEVGTSMSKHVAVYICYKWSITDCFVGQYINSSLTLHCFTVPLKLPHINISPQLYMMSPSLSHFVLPIVQCSAAVCMFVMCGIGRCDEFTGCAELRLDTCEYPYHGCYAFCSTETH